jgi:hypothetical protein
MNDFFVLEPCNSAKGFEIKFKEKRIDLKKAMGALSKLGEVIVTTPVVLLAKIEDCSLSVYASGRIMMKSENRLEKKKADLLANNIAKALEKEGALI